MADMADMDEIIERLDEAIARKRVAEADRDYLYTEEFFTATDLVKMRVQTLLSLSRQIDLLASAIVELDALDRDAATVAATVRRPE